MRRAVTCWRCGASMPHPIDMHLVPDAPCRDCRDVLELLDGVPTSEWTTRETRTEVAA